MFRQGVILSRGDLGDCRIGEPSAMLEVSKTTAGEEEADDDRTRRDVDGQSSRRWAVAGGSAPAV
jgi:hypothetical protein